MSDVAVTARIDEIRSMLAAMTPQRPAAAAPATVRGGAPGFAAQLAGAAGSYPGGYAGPVAGPVAGQVAGQVAGPVAGPASGTVAAGAGAPTSGVAGPAGGPVDGDAVVADARTYLGIPYRWGGTDPATGLDCSGLVQRVFGDLGVRLPRTVSEQRDAGVAVAGLAEAKPGDLLVFGSHHIGIYVGGGKMLHAPHRGEVVKVADVYATPSRIRRVLQDSPLTGAGSTTSAVTSAVTSAAFLPSGATAPATAVSGGAAPYEGLFNAATARYGLPPGLLRAVARTESGFDPGARSHAGAIGLMQLMPGTARGLGVDPTDPAQAVDGAARLLRDHLRTFGSLELALAAYNAGPGAVRRYDGVPPYRETQGYVRKVLAAMGQVAA